MAYGANGLRRKKKKKKKKKKKVFKREGGKFRSIQMLKEQEEGERGGGGKKCEKKTIIFLLWSPISGEERPKCRELQRLCIEDEEQIVGKLLFNRENIEKIKNTIYKFWKIREKRLQDLENEIEWKKLKAQQRKHTHTHTQKKKKTTGSANTKAILPTYD